jgi:ketosteroid isomerase-like protein
MSKDIDEWIRANYEAFNQALAEGGDLRAFVRGAYDPEIVMEMGTIEGTVRGLDAVERFIAGQAAIIEGLRSEPEEVIEADGRIVVAFRLSGRARSTGLPVEFHLFHVITLREGKAVHIELFANRSKALQAVALAP